MRWYEDVSRRNEHETESFFSWSFNDAVQYQDYIALDYRMIIVCWAVGGMRNDKGKLKYWEKTHPSATLSTTDTTWPDLRLDLGCCSGKLATNCLSYVTAFEIESKIPQRKTKFNVDIIGRRDTMQKEERTSQETEEEKIALRRQTCWSVRWTAADPSQHSHSWFQVPRDSWPHFTVSQFRESSWLTETDRWKGLVATWPIWSRKM